MRKLAIVLAALLAVALILSVIGLGCAIGGERETEEGEESGSAACCASTAYASTDDPDLNHMREFRDDYLVTNPVGRGLAALYYEVLSPPVARFINDHPSVRPLARAALFPAVALSTLAVDTTLAEKLAILGFLALTSVAVVVWAKRRRGKGLQNS